MTLAPGTQIGPYEIAGPLGAGGMGEVYRATDTKLKRQVAIKVLPASLADDPERLARFQREAETLARLNHPHIAQVHGFEDSTSVKALVMELVEGPTLADRIAEGPIPLDEALPIARQIAEALETAHEQGIVHRDLKPANIKLRPDGAVKVLDFGLAKAMGSISAMSPGQSLAQTITTPAMPLDYRSGHHDPSTRSGSPRAGPRGEQGQVVTQAGVILGTAAYMAPEQAAGKATDRRADIFSFGAVLYEMLTGRRTFDGDSVSETVASVLKVDPDWNAVPASTPVAIRRLIQRCLTKDRNERLQAIGEARIVLQHPRADEPVASAVAAPSRRAWVIAATSTVLLLATLAFLAYQYASMSTEAPQPARLSLLLPDGWQLSIANRQGVPTSLVISPNGRIVAMVARHDNGADTILVRPIDSPVAQPLAGSEGASSMFWSPDSRYLAFVLNGRLMKIDVTGGPPATLCDVTGNFAGGTWSQEGTIVFSASSGSGNYTLRKVSADGGTPTDVWPDSASSDAQISRIRPSFLPDGRHFLYATAVAGGQAGRPTVPIEAGSLDSAERVMVVNSGSTNVQYAQERLVYLRDSTLMAQPFDAERLSMVGDAVPVAEQIQRQGVQPPYGLFSVSANGVLVYQTGTNTGSLGGSQLTWVDRTGSALGTVGEPGNYNNVAVSPDATRAVVGEVVPLADLWMVDLARGVRTRLTFGSSTTLFPVWSHDGRQIAFGTARNGPLNIYLKAANGTGGEDPAIPSGMGRLPSDWSPDGRYLLFGTDIGSGQAGLMAMPMQGDRQPFTVLATRFNNFPATFSPDGRWIAYSSNESGRSEVYVTRFTPPEASAGSTSASAAPTTGEKVRVSPGGGTFPKWRRDGHELYYVTPPPDPNLMAAAVSGQDTTFTVSAVTPLFRLAAPPTGVQGWFWDASPDGKRFLIIQPVQVETSSSPQPPTIVFNWLPRTRR